MFKPRPYDPNRVSKQTPAQVEATARNFSIFKIRGLWTSAAMLAEPYRTAARVAIDADLVARGALSQAEHDQAQSVKFAKKWAGRTADKAAAIAEGRCGDCGELLLECECIPF